MEDIKRKQAKRNRDPKRERKKKSYLRKIEREEHSVIYLGKKKNLPKDMCAFVIENKVLLVREEVHLLCFPLQSVLFPLFNCIFNVWSCEEGDSRTPPQGQTLRSLQGSLIFSFSYKGSNLRYFIQSLETLLVKLTKTHDLKLRFPFLNLNKLTSVQFWCRHG